MVWLLALACDEHIPVDVPPGFGDYKRSAGWLVKNPLSDQSAVHWSKVLHVSLYTSPVPDIAVLQSARTNVQA